MLPVIERAFVLDSAVDVIRDFHTYEVDEQHLVVAPSRARWCVLPSRLHVTALESLANRLTIRQARERLANAACSIEKAHDILAEVLIEVEEKGFYEHAAIFQSTDFDSLKLNITQACNLRCRHCYRFSGEALADELSTTEWLHIVDDHAALGGSSILIAGGEPLSRSSKTVCVLQRAKQRGMKTVMISNGTLISLKLARRLLGLLDQLQVSIDGPDAQTNDLVRGTGTFDRAMAGLRHFRNSQVRIIVAMTPLPNTISAYEERCTALISRLREWFGENVVFTFSGVLLDGRQVRGLRGSAASRWSCRMKALRRHVWGEDLLAKADAASYVPGRKITGCGFGASLCIEPNGDVLPCDLARGMIVGNVRHAPLEELEARLRMLRAATSVDRSPVCCRCPLRYLCGGTCRLGPALSRGQRATVPEVLETVMRGEEFIPQCDDALKQELCCRLVASNAHRYRRLP